MELDDIIQISDDVISREVGGEFVLLHLDSGLYFGLNDVGGRMWQLFGDGHGTLAAVRDQITKEFDVSLDDAGNDVLKIAQELLEHGLIRLCG